jgi:hypothetical protein
LAVIASLKPQQDNRTWKRTIPASQDGPCVSFSGNPSCFYSTPANFETFLFLAQTAALKGKVGGAFGSYTHSGDAPKIIFDTMEFVFKMKVTELGSFNMLENVIGTSKGLKSCHDYGKAIGEEL